MINHTESFTHRGRVFDNGFPTNTKGVFEIQLNGQWHQATIVDSYDLESPGLCWQLTNGGATVPPELVSSSRKIG